MTDLIIEKKNESFIILSGEASVLQEIDDAYTFYADGYKYMKAYKAKLWSGQIHLLKRKSQNRGEIYHGLLSDILEFCKKRNYSVELSEALIEKNDWNDGELLSYIESLKISSKGQLLELRDYQIKGIIDSIKNKRQLIQCVTSGGKSAILYGIIRHLLNNNKKGLLLVPNVSLVHQMVSDFDDYSSLNDFDCENNIHVLYSGQEKHSDKPLYISTWQNLSAYLRSSNSNKNFNVNNKAKALLESFEFVINDECFAKGTKVLSTSGYKNIEDIVPGEKVINYDEINKVFKEDEVVKLHTNPTKAKELYEITLENGRIFRVTGNHKILTKNGWKRADHLTQDDEIKSI